MLLYYKLKDLYVSKFCGQLAVEPVLCKRLKVLILSVHVRIGFKGTLNDLSVPVQSNLVMNYVYISSFMCLNIYSSSQKLCVLNISNLFISIPR